MGILQATHFADDFVFLEGLQWHEGELWASDVFDHRVYAMAGGRPHERRLICQVPARPSGLGFLPDGSLIIASARDRRLLRHDNGKTSLYADLQAHATGSVNDFTIDAQGRVYVGNFGYDFDAGEEQKATALHRVDPDGTISEVAKDVYFPNGAVIINGGATLIFAETWMCRLKAFDLSSEGRLSNARIFADLGERQPDGICADVSGAIWVACYNSGEFIRVIEGGEISHHLAFKGLGITCTLGGKEGRELFMSVYAGTPDEVMKNARKGIVFKAQVDVPCS